MSRYYQYQTYLTQVFGGPLHRVPIDLGLGCPHRKPDGSGGCTFCPEDGARAPQTKPAATIADQVQTGMAFARNRYGATRFMAYVQAFTGTLAPTDWQKDFYRRLLEQFSFDAISIGTRPDCLPPDVLDFLADLAGECCLWVELGVQTTHDATLERINRGHTWQASRQAILALHARGISVAPHVILGLPGETEQDYVDTARTLATLPIDAIKIHNLHILKGTALAGEYRASPFPLLDEEDYAFALIDFLRALPPALPVMRLTTDSPDKDLLAPRWVMKKGPFLDYLNLQMERMDAQQGDRCDRMQNG